MTEGTGYVYLMKIRTKGDRTAVFQFLRGCHREQGEAIYYPKNLRTEPEVIGGRSLEIQLRTNEIS